MVERWQSSPEGSPALPPHVLSVVAYGGIRQRAERCESAVWSNSVSNLQVRLDAFPLKALQLWSALSWEGQVWIVMLFWRWMVCSRTAFVINIIIIRAVIFTYLCVSQHFVFVFFFFLREGGQISQIASNCSQTSCLGAIWDQGCLWRNRAALWQSSDLVFGDSVLWTGFLEMPRSIFRRSLCISVVLGIHNKTDLLFSTKILFGVLRLLKLRRKTQASAARVEGISEDSCFLSQVVTVSVPAWTTFWGILARFTLGGLSLLGSHKLLFSASHWKTHFCNHSRSFLYCSLSPASFLLKAFFF